MDEGSTSRTAQRVAMRRAMHQLVDQPVVFNDLLAMRVIGADAAREILEIERAGLEACGEGG